MLVPLRRRIPTNLGHFAMVREIWSEINLFVICNLFQGHVAVGHIPTFWPGSPHWGHHHGRILASLPWWIHGKESVSTLSSSVSDPYRIHLIRIRGSESSILGSIPSRIQGFDDQKLKKIYGWENTVVIYFFFLSKIAIYLSLGLHKEAFSPQREHPALQNMKFLNLFFIFVGHFCPPGAGRIRIPNPYPVLIRNSFYFIHQLPAAKKLVIKVNIRYH